MKRFLFSCLLIFFLLPGCTSLQVKREVVDNTLYSSANPKLQIKVSSEFEYLGEIKDVGDRKSVGGTRMLTNWSKWYIFVDPEGSRAARVVSIKLERTETRYTSDLFGWAKIFYGKGTCQLGGKSFQFFSRRIYPSMSVASFKYITEKGYVLPRCAINKRFARAYGAKNNILVDITCLEDLSELPYSCSDWSPDSVLQQDQIEYIEQFNSNCDNSFAVLKYEAGKEIYTTADNYKSETKKFKTSDKSEQKAEKYIIIQSRQPIFKAGKVIFYALEGDTLDIILEKTCLSGTGICWKVKCRRTGGTGYVVETMIRKNHQVIEREVKYKKTKKTEKSTLIVKDSRQVDYNTASNLCKSKVSDTGYIYRLPSPDEFKDLFKRNKGTDSLSIFEGKTYMTDSLGKVYPVVFSFASGSSDKGFSLTARVACISTD